MMSRYSSRRSIRLVAIAAALCLGMAAGGGIAWPERVSAETWTNLAGTASIEAKMVGLWDDIVILEKSDGRRIRVDLESLRADTRIQARNLAEQLAAERKDRIAELKQQFESGGAPAPDPLPQPAPAPEYSAPENDTKIGEFLRQVNDALAGGHVRVFYDALPPSYRQEARELLQDAAKKMNEQTWKSLVETPRRLGDLVVTRQNWLFSSPRFANFPPEQQEQIKEFFLGIGHVLRQGLREETVSLEALRDEDFDQLLTAWDQAVAPYVAAAIKNAELDFDTLTEVISESEDEAVVEVGVGDSAVEQTYQRIEGYWVPQSLADSWTDNVAKFKQEIADATDGEFMAAQAQVLGAGAALLDSLAQAESADEFHTAFDTLLTPLKSVIPEGLLTISSDGGSESNPAAKSAGDSDDDAGKSLAERMRKQLGTPGLGGRRNGN